MSDERELTRKELVEICNKQEEYIKELEEKLKTPNETLKCSEEAKPDYDELDRERCDLHEQLNALIEENNALRWALVTAHKEMSSWKNCFEMMQENYYKEYKRAERLYDEWKELKRKNNDD